MSHNDNFTTLDSPRFDATLPSAHPPPNGDRGRSDNWRGGDRDAAAKKACDAQHGVVAIDSTIVIRDLATDEVEEYTLVHPDHADILQNRISTFTPIGNALFGRSVGEVVNVEGPNGPVPIRIESIRCRCMEESSAAG